MIGLGEYQRRDGEPSCVGPADEYTVVAAAMVSKRKEGFVNLCLYLVN